MAILEHNKIGLGVRPALIIVDATRGFTDPESPLGCFCNDEMRHIGRLLDAFRSRSLPVIYTSVVYGDSKLASVFRAKIPALNVLQTGSDLTIVDPRIAPKPGETVITKSFASAFFDTNLRALLAEREVDSVVVCGFSTSGCVRATAVDALQCNLRLVVAGDACGDRDRYAHDANLRDLNLKYGDVISTSEVVAALSVSSPSQGARARP